MEEPSIIEYTDQGENKGPIEPHSPPSPLLHSLRIHPVSTCSQILGFFQPQRSYTKVLCIYKSIYLNISQLLQIVERLTVLNVCFQSVDTKYLRTKNQEIKDLLLVFLLHLALKLSYRLTVLLKICLFNLLTLTDKGKRTL